MEKINPPPRELKFGGEGKTETIRRGFAITTLRNPKEAYNFAQGEVILADCFNDGEKVSIVVISNETKKLRDFSVPQLALDGFFSPEHAADGMSAWPGYENTTIDSEMQAITFIAEETFDKLPEDFRKIITNENFDYFIGFRQLRHLFYPTMCANLAAMGEDVNTWLDFLKANHLLSKHDAWIMKNFKFREHKIFSLFIGRSEALYELSLEASYPFFKPLILGIDPDQKIATD